MITPSNMNTVSSGSDLQSIDKIKLHKSNKVQLEKVSQEFESIFVTKMLTLMDKTVDKEEGIFGNEEKYMSTFKSYIFQEMGRDIAKNPRTSFGFAKQIYQQMERYLPPDTGQDVIGASDTVIMANMDRGVKMMPKTEQGKEQVTISPKEETVKIGKEI